MKHLYIFLTLFFVSSCSHKSGKELNLVQLQIIDQNGIVETISSQDRLKKYKEADFLSQQPYQKITRFYQRNSQGHVISHITSYYPNGQLKQYLEATDLRAFGQYKEWHPNGQLKISAQVIGGQADFQPFSQKDWLFEGKTTAYDQQGNILAEFPYEKGVLSGEVTYYYPDMQVKEKKFYKEGRLEGESFSYYPNGSLLKKCTYLNDSLDGISLTYWAAEIPSAIEEYEKGLLQRGVYYNNNKKVCSEIQEGKGTRFVLLNGEKYQIQEYLHGKQQGQVQTYNEEGKLLNVYSVKNGKKNGTETQFYTQSETPLDDMGSVMEYSIDWIENKIHGTAKSWYPCGVMESQKQFAHNKKNGSALYWYKDGSLMAVEEYENDVFNKWKVL